MSAKPPSVKKMIVEVENKTQTAETAAELTAKTTILVMAKTSLLIIKRKSFL